MQMQTKRCKEKETQYIYCTLYSTVLMHETKCHFMHVAKNAELLSVFPCGQAGAV